MKNWKQMEQTEAVAQFAENEAVYVLKRVGSERLGFETLRFKGKVKRLLITHVLVEWIDRHSVVHQDRLLPERLEKREAEAVSEAPQKRVFQPKRGEINETVKQSIRKAVQPIEEVGQHAEFIKWLKEVTA